MAAGRSGLAPFALLHMTNPGSQHRKAAPARCKGLLDFEVQGFS